MLSIIIPTLNEGKNISVLLDSIKRQSFNDCEIIVADAKSTDNTVEIAKKYGCRVVEGGLVAKGRNNGAKEAKGELLLFLDADITLPVSFLENAVKEFQKSNLGIAGFTIFPLSDKLIDKLAYDFFNKWAEMTQKFSPHGVGAIMATKKVHDAIGGFDETIVFVEDYSYVKSAAKISKFKYIKEPFFTSVRRYEKDGRFKTYLRYFLAELHVLFFGPVKTDIFKYKFAHYENKEKTKN